MNNQDPNGDSKQDFGKTKNLQNCPQTDESEKKALSDKEKALEEKKQERRESIEDTSSNNYGNIGVEGGVEDLDEED